MVLCGADKGIKTDGRQTARGKRCGKGRRTRDPSGFPGIIPGTAALMRLWKRSIRGDLNRLNYGRRLIEWCQICGRIKCGVRAIFPFPFMYYK